MSQKSPLYRWWWTNVKIQLHGKDHSSKTLTYSPLNYSDPPNQCKTEPIHVKTLEDNTKTSLTHVNDKLGARIEFHGLHILFGLLTIWL